MYYDLLKNEVILCWLTLFRWLISAFCSSLFNSIISCISILFCSAHWIQTENDFFAFALDIFVFAFIPTKSSSESVSRSGNSFRLACYIIYSSEKSNENSFAPVAQSSISSSVISLLMFTAPIIFWMDFMTS